MEKELHKQWSKDLEENQRLKVENKRKTDALTKLKRELVIAGEYWDEPEVKILREWNKIIDQALKGK